MLEKLIIFVEEESMEAALHVLLPKMIGNIDPSIIDIKRYQGKNDLLKKLPDRLKAYRSYIQETWRIIVLLDRDNEDCRNLKHRLETIAASAGLHTKTATKPGQHFHVINRIAVEELESWFFGDWDAVKTAYPGVLTTIPKKLAYRDPDAITGGTWEALERVLMQGGYFSTGLRKIEFARTTAQYMVPTRNRSRSFQAFQEAVIAALSWPVEGGG